MRHAGIDFTDEVIPLYSNDFKDRVKQYSKAGQVPVLLDKGEPIWGSLAILEYLHEKFPEKNLWPSDQMLRAKARAGAGEMHSGFGAMRQRLPMHIRLEPKQISLDEDVKSDVARIEELWTDCIENFSDGGPFLFGKFCNIDAMYAPVVNRFHVYKVPVSGRSREYMDAVMDLPAWKDFEADARAEPWELDLYIRD